MDDRYWRIAVKDGQAGVAYVGWEVASLLALDRVKSKLSAAGFVGETNSELANVRGVLDLFTCKDPSGFNLEFYYGAQVHHVPFASPAGARFVTSHEGRSLGIGHIVMLVDDVTATSDFYMSLLEFEPSDAIINGAMGVTFAHVNPRHHSLAFGAVKGSMVQGLDHLMLEVDDLDVVGCALDRLMEKEVPVTLSLGKHSNDYMTSFYIRTPSGFDIEYGVGGRLVEDTWVPTWFRKPSIWGHRRNFVPKMSAKRDISASVHIPEPVSGARSSTF